MTQTPSQPQGVWAWILQRFTAVLLVVFLGTHIFVLHYVPENLNINFVGVAFRFKSLLYLIIDSGLLATGLYHGLNGLRNVIFDFVINDGTRTLINWVLLIVGIGFTAYGAYALTFFMK